VRLRVTFAVVWLAACSAVLGLADETRIERKDLPPAVETTVAEESRGATIRGFAREVEDGRTQYEVELTIDGHARDVLIDEKGGVVEIEDEIPLEAPPAPVSSGLQKAAGAGHIVKVESLTRRGALVAYEAAVEEGTNRFEVQVDPDGKLLSDPE